MRIIAIYLFAIFAINIGIQLTSNDNTFLLEVYTISEFLLFTVFLYVQLKSRFAKKLLVSLSILYVCFFFIYTYALSKNIKFIDSVPIGVETLLILPFSFFCLYEQTSDNSTLFIYSRPVFWIILGIALYLAGSFFIYLYANFLTAKEVRNVWYITNIFSILKQIFFCIAIYINAKPPNENYNLDLSRLN